MQFLDFVKYFEPKVTGFREQMFPKWEAANYRTGLSTGSGETVFKVVPDIEDEATLSRLLTWCIWAPGATSFQKIIFAERAGGEPSSGVKELIDLERRSGRVYLDAKARCAELEVNLNDAAAKIVADRNRFNSTVIDLKNKNDQLEADRKRLLDQARPPPPTRVGGHADNSRRITLSGAEIEARQKIDDKTSEFVAIATRVEKAVLDIKRRQKDDNLSQSLSFWLSASVVIVFIVGFGIFSTIKLWNFNPELLVTKVNIQKMDESIGTLLEQRKTNSGSNGLQQGLGQEDVVSPLQDVRPQVQKNQGQSKREDAVSPPRDVRPQVQKNQGQNKN